MNKLNHLETLMKKIAENGLAPDSEQDRDFEDVGSHTEAFIAYHNEAVSQGLQLTMAGIRFGTESQFVEFAEKLHERRKALHQSMIDAAIALNGLCEKYDIEKIYDGPLNAEKGRGDDDTRFGVAKFGEELCRDLFRTTETVSIPGKAVEAYRKFRQDVKSDYDANGRKPGAPSSVFEMLRKAAAQNGMDASEGLKGPEDDI